MANQGGAFIPSADYTTTGDWVFEGDVTVNGTLIDTGSTFASPTITGTVAGGATYTAPVLTTPTLGVASATTVNKVTITAPATAATLTLIEGTVVTGPAATGTLATLAGSETLTNKTLTAPIIAAINSDLSVTGTVESADATTPILSTATGKTNTGYLSLTGKTSGSLKVLPADAMAQIVTIAPAAQTSGASTLTIPDQAGVSSDFVFTSLAQTLTNKTIASSATVPYAAGVAAGYVVARGQHTTVDEDDTIVTGLATVVSAIAVMESDPVAGAQHVTCVIGNQSGAPAAGSIQVKSWKATAAGDTALIPATTFSKLVNWIAIGV